MPRFREPDLDVLEEHKENLRVVEDDAGTVGYFYADLDEGRFAAALRQYADALEGGD